MKIHCKLRLSMKLLLIIVSLSQFSFSYGQTVKIEMQKVKGVYQIPCKVNNLQLNFVFDTGATFVSLSRSTALFMLENAYLSVNDLYDVQKIQQADGTNYTADKVKLREINIGGFLLKDVDAIITPTQDAPLLLGLSAIQKLGKVAIKDNYLVINSKNVKYSGLDEDIAFLGLKRGSSYDECEAKLMERFGENKVLHSSLNKEAYILEVENEIFINKKFDFISLYFDGEELTSAQATKYFSKKDLSKALSFRDGIFSFLKRKYKATKKQKVGDMYEYVLGYKNHTDNGLYPIKVEIVRTIQKIRRHEEDETELLEGYEVAVIYWPSFLDKITNDYVEQDEY